MIEPKNENLSIKKQCRILSLALSTYYYKGAPIDQSELSIMKSIDEIYLENPYYGSRKMSKALKAQGYEVGRKKARRLMREMGIKAIYCAPRTSIPNKGDRVYPYLLNGVDINKPNKVWCTDITYIRLKTGFAYLVAIMDWHSRYVISWKLSNTMDVSFCNEALEEALEIGKPEIFNSDQGSQFTSEKFTSILQSNGIKISMDGKGRCMDNIFIERLWRSLKYEEVYLTEYNDLNEARKGISNYLKKYNNKRPHQSLDYEVPFSVWNCAA